MGGIAGMVRFDGQPVASATVTALTTILKHRGHSTGYSFEQGHLVAFGGTVEIDATSNTYAAVDADVFTGTGNECPFVTRYTAGGPSSFDALRADFAVCVCDTRRQTLICARDPLGIKPLYYVYRPCRFFAFASEIKVLLALPEIDVTPNYLKFREYLTWPTAYVPYSEETFYETIYSVLPGHYLQVNSQTLTQHAYWKIDFTKFSGLHSTADYAALFKDYFAQAVADRIKNRRTIGAHLSGGLDSSSVSCMAQVLANQQHRPPIHTFTIDPGLASTDERRYVQAVVDQYHTQHQTVRPLSNVLEAVLQINQQFDRPEHFIIPSSFHLSGSLAARQASCDIILTGHDGDSVVTPGFEFLDALIEAADWQSLRDANRQFVGYRDRALSYVDANWQRLNDDEKYQKQTLYALGPALKKQFRQQSLGAFLATLYQQKQVLGISSAALLAYGYQRITARLARRGQIDTALRPDFDQQFPPKPARSTQPFTDAFEESHRHSPDLILNTTNVICNEQLNHMGAYYGHLYSFPFFDKNVIELGLATPLNIRFDNGRGRGLIRQGLREILPPSIVNRLTKTNFVEYGNTAARQLYDATYEHFSATSHPIWDVVDRAVFFKISAIVFSTKIPVNRKTRYNWQLSRIIYLALWLGSLPRKS